MYDVIVLGATFAAAGIARVFRGKCLILESGPWAGYEFFNALHFGSAYDRQAVSDEGRALYQTFLEKQAVTEDRICIFDCAPPFYKLLEGLDVLLNMQILSAEKSGNGFLCVTHGVSGYRTFRAKRIIDTRCHPEQCCAKTYNLLIDGTGSVSLPPDVKYEPWGLSHNYVLRCRLPLDAGYPAARKRAMEVVKQLPEEHRLLLLADVFDYQVRAGYPKEENGIPCLPSKAWENPVLAFDAGVCFAQGGGQL